MCNSETNLLGLYKAKFLFIYYMSNKLTLNYTIFVNEIFRVVATLLDVLVKFMKTGWELTEKSAKTIHPV